MPDLTCTTPEDHLEMEMKERLAKALSPEELRDAWYNAMDRFTAVPVAASLGELRWFAILMVECHNRFMQHPPRGA